MGAQPRPADYIAVCALLGACAAQAPIGAQAPAQTHADPMPTVPANPPAGGDSGCQLMLHTSVERAVSGEFELVVRAENPGDASLSLLVHTRCPGGPAVFRGLPEGYDYGATCVRGACRAGPTGREAITLAAGTAFELARVAIASKGDSCNPALPDGRYVISASADIEGARACQGSEAVLTVAGQKAPSPAPPAPAPPTAPIQEQERCPAMGCAFVPCPPGVAPPTGCARICGCAGMRGADTVVAPHQ